MKKYYDTVIIGGGIIGCSIAYYLAKEKMDVAVLESGEVGAMATNAAAGMLGAHSECDDMEVFYPFARRSQQDYFDLKQELKDIANIDIGLKTGGIYKLAFSEQEKKDLAALCSLSSVEWLGTEQIRQTESLISPNIMGAAYIENDVHVLPRTVCRGFGMAARLLGADIQENTPVYDIQKLESSYLVKTPGMDIKAKYVIVASGVWSTSFFNRLGLDNRIIPVKGECLSVRNVRVLLKHTLFHDHHYIVPRSDGTWVIGATMIENDWSEAPTLGGIEKLIRKAKEIVPAVAGMEIASSWAGLRPQTFDQKPFIGRHPEQDRLLFATGHFRNGILLAPATGKMIRDFILEKEMNKEWIEAFKIDRKNKVLV